ncbi:unnamed protein product [Aureobasidium pullulans]|nr:unnamed protein product [Aureobasidium pullulans]
MPYSRPKDHNCTEGKKPIACKCAIGKSKVKPTEETPNNEITTSIQEHITPYIRNQLKHEEEGRGLRKGSVFQMHLMMNLRIRNAVDEEKLKEMEKDENGVEEEEEG